MKVRARALAGANILLLVTTLGVASLVGGGSAKAVACPEDKILEAPHALFAAWNNNDAAGVAAVFTSDAHFVPTDGRLLLSREQIQAYYTAAFAGPLKGTRMIGQPTTIRCLDGKTAVIDGTGAILIPGETATTPYEGAAGRKFRVSWVGVKDSGAWKIYQFAAIPSTLS